MSRWFSAAAIALGGLVLARTGNAYAQSSETLRATIPFDFKVGQATLPAGEYSVTYDATEAPGVLVVRSEDGHHDAVALTEPVTNAHPTKDAKLVFERKGTARVLSEVFNADAQTGLEIVGTHPAD